MSYTHLEKKYPLRVHDNYLKSRQVKRLYAIFYNYIKLRSMFLGCVIINCFLKFI